MIEISEQSECPFIALPVQKAFHQFEDSVYKELTGRIPTMQSLFIEPNEEEPLVEKPLTSEFCNTCKPYSIPSN